MAKGNKPLKKNENVATPETLFCMCCGKSSEINNYYDSDSELYRSIGKIPYCKDCIEKFYNSYLSKYQKQGYLNVEKKALERLCMIIDIYFSEEIYDKAVKNNIGKVNASAFALYLKQIKLYQYRKKNYDTTIHDRYIKNKNDDLAFSVYSKEDRKLNIDIEKAVEIFGTGYSNDDYLYLYEQYMDWTARHECQTKSQEEIFKRICFKQLEIRKASMNEDDTKDLDASFLKMLEAAKLQPKQNRAETVSDTQTFGTLIDKWENTRPIPECDPELRDVDRIGKYINIFFKGHLSKMMGIKNVFCKAYDDFMKKYSVQRPEYESEDSNSEALFDVIFGGDLDDR